MATYSGKMITWDEALNSDRTLAPIDDFVSFDDPAPVLPDGNGHYPVPMPGVTEVI